MKGLFPQYEPQTEAQKKDLWDKAVFVFDTNVLLNLYRYQSSTRQQLLDVLDKLSDRIWIPHHAALEFQRNRVTVINEQNNKFDAVRSAIQKATDTLRKALDELQLKDRHSLINPDPLLSAMDKVTKRFLTELDKTEENQQKPAAPDLLKKQIENLFDGKTGPEPENQKVVDDIYGEAKKRFENEVPPGYKDAGKGNNGSDLHSHKGITYKRKYGDFMIWCQLLAHAKNEGIKYLIFVTDDAKDDWWWNLSSSGKQIIGPRPELIDEARTDGGITSFGMYNPENFLKHAIKFLDATISGDALEEVRDISQLHSDVQNEHWAASREKEILRDMRAISAVDKWLSERYSSRDYSSEDFLRFICYNNKERIGFAVADATFAIDTKVRFKKLSQAVREIGRQRVDIISIIWIAKNIMEALHAVTKLKKHGKIMYPGHSRQFRENKLSHFVGIVSDGELEIIDHFNAV